MLAWARRLAPQLMSEATEAPTLVTPALSPERVHRAAPGRPPAKPPKPWRRWLAIAAIIGLVLAIIGALAAAGLIIWASRDLPTIRSLADYRPPQATVVYDKNGVVVARYATERRTVVPYSEIPADIVKAVTASEDAGFFSHSGLDYLGMVRCGVKSLLAGRARCGASTITQQTVKTFLLTPERTLTRKLKEAVLAKRLEEALTKEDILFLYLNQIYFGHGAYGVEEAARVYFGVHARELNTAQAALLAGLPQSPSRLDPYRHPKRALRRREYVLRRMHEVGHINDAEYASLKESPLDLAWGAKDALESDSSYIDQVRKIVIKEVGEEATMTGGLRVYTGMDARAQASAERAVHDGLLALDKRQGWRGPIFHFEPGQLPAFQEGLAEALSAQREKAGSAKAPLVWDLSQLGSEQIPVAQLPEQARFVRLKKGAIVGGLVTQVLDAQKLALVDLGGAHVELPLRAGLSWARPFNIHHRTRAPRRPSQVLNVGDVVLVRALTPPGEKSGEKQAQAASRPGRWVGVLEQQPLAQAALVSMDPASRELRAIVGGYGSGAGTFNRAIQAKRQAGSTFKPFVYATAFSTLEYTPISHCLDAPRVYRDPWAKRTWKPQNYGHRFDGEITLRRALTLSKNLCSVELIDKIGVDPVLNFAKRVGITSRLPRNLTLSLGSGDVSPLEMTNAYATLATQGLLAEPIFVKKITEPDGTVLFEHKADPKSVIRADVAYLTTSLMQSVVEEGSGRRVRALKRPVAGKTGTTNEARNAWFIGFTPDLVTGVWVGFDNNDPLGRRETGGRAAIPIWLEYMQAALADHPVLDFVAPAGIVFALVDPGSGKLALPKQKDAMNEPFIAGTEPTDFASEDPPTDQLQWEDYQ